MVKAWRTSAVRKGDEMQDAELEKSRKKRKKQKSKGEDENRRFKPY